MKAVQMTRADLERMRSWADAKIATGEEPPWAWYQYMKLRETLDAIIAGMASTQTIRLVHDSDSAVAVQLPM